MYVVTFYSFKGGVGRSMALVNVAAELTRRGKRVLIVDFDLEAPGLDTFDITRSENQSRGLLDLVCAFRESSTVPDVREYLYRVESEVGPGELWVMPSGMQDAEYHTRFRSFDWVELYDKYGGYLLFEDLKEQWKYDLKFDYVLVDSRTGHTDVAGICTRQLPDAVVLFFFPNEQNRRGLELIVSQVRGEPVSPTRKKKIQVHFVMSNVPDLDDEDEILQREIEKFEASLGFGAPTAVIHHYDSLALLEQLTFVRTRPRSRLAKEYAELTMAIVRKNLEDREGAMSFLEHVRRRSNVRAPIVDLEVQLQEIREKHSSDPLVLGRLAALRLRQMKNEEALAILTQALNSNPGQPDLRLKRAQLLISSGQKEGAVLDLKHALMSSEITGFDLGIVIRMLREAQSDLVPLIARSPALDRLEPNTDLVEELETSPETLSLAVRLLSNWLPTIDEPQLKRGLKLHLSLCLIGRGSYKEAMDLLGYSNTERDTLDVPYCFNYTMAVWGLEGKAPVTYLERLASLTEDYRHSNDPNHVQCFSLVNQLLGRNDVASELLLRAHAVNQARRASSFSCWSYLKVSVERFTSDLEEMQSAFASEIFVPEFIRRNAANSSVQKTPGV